MSQVLVHQIVADPGQTVWQGRGVDLETGDAVLFGGDHRPMAEIAWALREQPEVIAEVPDWAVLYRQGGEQ